MPQFPSSTATVRSNPGSNLLVGHMNTVVDRPMAASLTVLLGQLMVRDGSYWRDSDAYRADAADWQADTTYAVDDVVLPATKTTVAVGGSNTGDGTFTLATPAVGAAVLDGDYTVECILAASNEGTFLVTGPNGGSLGLAKVGVAYDSDHIKFTIADGAADFVVGDVFTVTHNKHYYKCTVAGDSNSTEPAAWDRAGSTTSDNEVTWLDMGEPDDLSNFTEIGVAYEAFTTAAAENPTMPVIEAGAVKRSLVVGLPAAYDFDGARIGNSLLTADS